MTSYGNIEEMLAEEYTKTLNDVREATDEDEKDRMIRRLEVFRKQLSEERDNERKHLEALRNLKREETEKEFREKDIQIKEAQMIENKKDRWIKVALEGLGLMVPTICTWTWLKRGMKFEETGTFTSRSSQWISGLGRMFKRKG